MTSPADLTDLFTPGPASGSQDVRYRQGTIVTFNPITLSNTVDVGGTVVTDLPLLGVGESSLLVAGSVVGILTMGSTGGATSMAIIGRLVKPATADAADAVGLLNSLIFADSIDAQGSTTSATFDDLDSPAEVGPRVTVTVRPSGRLLLLLTSQIQFIEFAAGGVAQRGGRVTAALTGANTVSAATVAATVEANMNLGVVATGLNQIVAQGAYTAAGVLEGLSTGETTVAMKYCTQYAGEQMDFSIRNLTVVAL